MKKSKKSKSLKVRIKKPTIIIPPAIFPYNYYNYYNLNTLNNNLFINNRLRIDKLEINIHVDVGTDKFLNIFNSYLVALGFKKCKHNLLYSNRGLYCQSDKYKRNSEKVILLYQIRDYFINLCKYSLPPFRLNIQDPTPDLLVNLKAFLDFYKYKLKCEYSVPCIEATIDFFNPDPMLKKIFERYLYLKRFRSNYPCRNYPENGLTQTFYIGNTHKDSKSIRIYKKEGFLRLELVLRKGIARKIGKETGLCIHDFSIPTVFRKYTCFKRFNEKRFFNYLIKEHYFIFRKIALQKGQDMRMLLIRQLAGITGIYSQGFLMNSIMRMRKLSYSNYFQFFDDIPELNELFFKSISGV